MRRADRIMSIIVLLFGLYVLITAFRLEYQLDSLPGPGFVPVWVGLTIVVLSLLILVGTFSRSADNRPGPFSAENIRNVVATLGGCALAMLLSSVTGFLVALGLLAGFLVRFFGTKSWTTTILVAVILQITLYLIFRLGLDVPLPKGLLGF